MNAKQVLNKIITLLSKDEVELTYAKLADGTIVESPTFDVGEPLEIVSEDGTKSKAPDGEHELALKDESGNENLIKVITKDGIIVERENVEMADEDAETKEVEPLPQADGAEPVEDVQMAETTEEVATIPQDDEAPMNEEPTEGEEEPTIEIELKEMIDKLSYRIEEMEKKMQAMEQVKEEVVDKEADIEEELPKLDGAPVEATKMSSEKSEVKFGKKSFNTQDRFLSKLYK